MPAPPPDIPPFALSQTVAAQHAEDVDALADALRKCGAGDRGFSAKTSHILAATPGELAQRVEALRAATSVPFDAGPVEVLTVWTPARVAEAEHRLGSADGGTGAFAVVRLRIVPRRSGEGNLFESEFAGPPEIDAFNAAVARGVARIWANGIDGAGQIVDTRVVFIDGAFHASRSSPAGFEKAAVVAMEAACRAAAMRRLDPLVEIEILAERDHVRPIVDDLTASGGSEIRRQLAAKGVVIVAELPMRAFLVYEARLASLTGRRGKLTGAPRLARFAEVRRG